MHLMKAGHQANLSNTAKDLMGMNADLFSFPKGFAKGPGWINTV